MPADIRDEVSKYIERNGPLYIEFQAKCINLLEDIRRDTGIIKEIYTRSKSQRGELKAVGKIVEKLIEMRVTNESSGVNDIFDIVGITAVVFYNDQIAAVIDAFDKNCSSARLMIEPYRAPDGTESRSRVHKDKGYHATHFKVVSQDPAYCDIRVEVQVKTMLHDAWGSKTHDLTYKPSSELDPRLKRLMESFGDSLQAIEIQSETLRDSIVYRMKLLRDLRQSALLGLAAGLARVSFADVRAANAFNQIFQDIKDNQKKFSECRTDDADLIAIFARVDQLQAFGVSAVIRLRLIAYVACLRFDTNLAPRVDRELRNWLAQLPPTNPIMIEWVTAAIYHQTRRLGEAIDRLRRFLDGKSPDIENAILYLNLANFMIETYFESPKQAERFGPEAKRIIDSIQPLFEGEPSLSENKKEFRSTLGAYYVVYGKNEKDWRDGISICLGSDDVEDGGLEYQRLFETLGWHKIIGTA